MLPRLLSTFLPLKVPTAFLHCEKGREDGKGTENGHKKKRRLSWGAWGKGQNDHGKFGNSGEWTWNPVNSCCLEPLFCQDVLDDHREKHTYVVFMLFIYIYFEVTHTYLVIYNARVPSHRVLKDRFDTSEEIGLVRGARFRVTQGLAKGKDT